MNLQRLLCSIFITCLAALLTVTPNTAEANKPDFSGSYILTGSKGAFSMEKGEVWTLQVSQTESSLQVKRVRDGRENTNEFPLNGSEGRYPSAGGPTGSCKARWKGKDLVLDSLVITHPQDNGPAVQLHTKERWELSLDLKTLTIRSDVDFPGSPVYGFQLIQPWSEIYTRN